ncbi:hypothetical protein ACFL6D_03230 [Spirochaetota bacterium]
MDLDACRQAFRRYTAETSEEEIQHYLEEEYKNKGLCHTLKLLEEWEYKTGYLTKEKLESNKRYEYFDKDIDVTFRAQVNFARDKYTETVVGKDKEKKSVTQGDTEGSQREEKEKKELHCKICYENIGTPGKENLRVFSFDIGKKRPFFIQLTPFPLFKRHFVLINREPVYMLMETQSVSDLVQFIEMAPGYVGCSNSDVEWAGASILVHHHYQVFDDLHLPIMDAGYIEAYRDEVTHAKSSLRIGILNYPIATCKLSCTDRDTFISVSGKIIEAWKAQMPGKNTCNLIVMKEKDEYTIYIMFRNPAHRTPEALTFIKSEGVGIIEAAGEGIYPVPKGELEKKAWDLIENHGLDVIKGIIEGNNPVEKEGISGLYFFVRNLCTA